MSVPPVFSRGVSACAELLANTFTFSTPREDLYRAILPSLRLIKEYFPERYPGDRFYNSVSDTMDAIVVVWLIQYIPYFFIPNRGEAGLKRKIYAETIGDVGRRALVANGEVLEYQDARRMDKTGFQFDMEFKPFRAFTHAAFLLTCIQSTAELFYRVCLTTAAQIGVSNKAMQFMGQAGYDRALYIWSKAGSAVLALAYGAYACDSIRYLSTMDQDLSRSPGKEGLRLVARASLAAYHALKLFGVTSKVVLAAFAITGSLIGLIAYNVMKFNKGEKERDRNEIFALLRQAVQLQPQQV